MTDKMKSTIVGGLIGGVCLVLSTTLPVYLSSRRELKEMRAKYEAAIAAMRERTAAQTTTAEDELAWRSLVQIDRVPVGGNIYWPVNATFSVNGIPRNTTNNGFEMANIWVGPHITFDFHGGGYRDLRFRVGVDETISGEGIKTSVLNVSFDQGAYSRFELTNDMKPSLYSVKIPEGARSVCFEIAKDKDMAGKTANYVFYDILVR
jgi:hypothetical protein